MARPPPLEPAPRRRLLSPATRCPCPRSAAPPRRAARGCRVLAAVGTVLGATVAIDSSAISSSPAPSVKAASVGVGGFACSWTIARGFESRPGCLACASSRRFLRTIRLGGRPNWSRAARFGGARRSNPLFIIALSGVVFLNAQQGRAAMSNPTYTRALSGFRFLGNSLAVRNPAVWQEHNAEGSNSPAGGWCCASASHNARAGWCVPAVSPCVGPPQA